MNWNVWIRQSHRWMSIAFTVTVIANFIALARGGGMPPPWITYSPLPPLALLLFTGLYMGGPRCRCAEDARARVGDRPGTRVPGPLQ